MVVLRCALVSGLRSVCVGGGCAVFCGIGLRSDLLQCALVSGLFCAVMLAVVVPCFLVLWFFFFFSCCGLVVVVVVVVVAVAVADGRVVMVRAVDVFWVVKYIILL